MKLIMFFSSLNQHFDIIICVYWFELFSQVSDVAHGPLVYIAQNKYYGWASRKDTFLCIVGEKGRSLHVVLIALPKSLRKSIKTVWFGFMSTWITSSFITKYVFQNTFESSTILNYINFLIAWLHDYIHCGLISLCLTNV